MILLEWSGGSVDDAAFCAASTEPNNNSPLNVQAADLWSDQRRFREAVLSHCSRQSWAAARLLGNIWPPCERVGRDCVKLLDGSVEYGALSSGYTELPGARAVAIAQAAGACCDLLTTVRYLTHDSRLTVTCPNDRARRSGRGQLVSGPMKPFLFTGCDWWNSTCTIIF